MDYIFLQETIILIFYFKIAYLFQHDTCRFIVTICEMY